ncbi:hypothetical protein M9H77_35389 [Catharanthus roseus]|uniref:Uncharacterized protein n=1 Tax=Catharanthus roseus TaxID=4058 RepID=A0ACB9ZNV6_CATRO|nr:hypothetical protein M9H77_35389 [Catharanthus roseus]
MGVEVTDICMDKEPDSVVTYSIPVSHDSNNISTNLQDVLPPCERGDEDLKCYAREETAEVSECEVKECTTEKPIEISTLCQVENGKDQDFSSNKCEIGASVEEQKSESRKAKDDCKKPRASMKPMVKSASGNCKTKCTVPQPFALATAKRASFGTRPLGTESDNVTTNKTLNTSTTPSSGTKQNQLVSPSVQRKPLQPTNKKHPDEEDSCSVASSVAASTRKPRATVASAPVFKSSERAARRKEFFSKLEEKHQALEAEKSQWEERTKEEAEAAIKQLRKSLLFKANPMPSFYHEGPPPKVELKKPPPTRAKSPKLGRKKSCSDSVGLEKGIGACGRGIRPTFNIYRDSPTVPSTNRKESINVQNCTSSISKDEEEPGVVDGSFATKMNSEMSLNIAVQS